MKLNTLMKQFDEILRSDSGYIKFVAVVIMCIQKNFHFGILKLFEENFLQDIKLYMRIFYKTSNSISFTSVWLTET